MKMTDQVFSCRPGCGACCIEPSITTPFYGMESGKPAGTPCIHLNDKMQCNLFNCPERPSFCGSLPPSKEMCGTNREEACTYLADLELKTKPLLKRWYQK